MRSLSTAEIFKWSWSPNDPRPDWMIWTDAAWLQRQEEEPHRNQERLAAWVKRLDQHQTNQRFMEPA